MNQRSATTSTVPYQGVTNASGITLKKSVRSEFIKFRSLRSLVWLSILGALTQAALGPIQALGLVLAEEQADDISNLDAAMSLVMSGLSTACILFGIAGVLAVTGEYPHKAIRGTFMAVPRRGLVVVAKLIAYFTIAGLAAVAGSVIALAGSLPSLNTYGFDVDVTSVDVVRVVAASSVYLVLWGCYGQLLGWLTRSTIGATMALLALFFVLPSLCTLLPRAVGEAIYPVLPSEAASAMLRLTTDSMTVSPVQGAALTVLYLVAGTALIVRWVRRRDA